MYCMNLNCFNKLVSILGPIHERDVIFVDMRGRAVSVESRVAIALRILAGASYLDLLQQHGVHRCIIYDFLWSIVDAINASDSAGPFCFPGGAGECRKLAADFKDKSEKGFMDRVVGAIDGLFVEIDVPSTSECLDQLSYYSGAKKGYGINVQAIAAANYHFSCMTVLHPGSTNNFCAYLRSDLPESTAVLPSGFHIVGDAAYPLLEKLLTPYVGKGLAEECDVFNFHLSQLRIKVEQSLGILVQKWGILWKPIRFGHAGRADIIAFLFRLHNFLRDEKIWNLFDSKRRIHVRKRYVRRWGTIAAFLLVSRYQRPPQGTRRGAKLRHKRHFVDPWRHWG